MRTVKLRGFYPNPFFVCLDCATGDNSDGRHATLILLGVTAAAVIISSLVTLGIFRSMVCCSENILLSLYFLVAGIWGLVGLLTVNFVPRFGISCFTTSALVFYVIHRGKKRIAFASANLKVSLWLRSFSI